MFLIEFSAIYQKGLKGWAKNLAEPVKFILPINIMEIFIRPLSLCMRLLGNILAAFVVMELIKLTVPLLLPLPFSFYFDIFDGLLQAYIFVFLTAIFINEKGETL
jgi:F-type H+-transporting ATPase subunit a